MRHCVPPRRCDDCPTASFFLTRYADLEHVYRDTATFSSDKRIEFKPKFGDSPLYEQSHDEPGFQ